MATGFLSKLDQNCDRIGLRCTKSELRILESICLKRNENKSDFIRESFVKRALRLERKAARVAALQPG